MESYHSDLLRAMRPLPGAKEGVAMLASVGCVDYYTARYSIQSEERSQAMAQATLEWLTAYNFVNPTSAIFLVDDQHTRLLQRLADLDKEPAQRLKRSLILVSVCGEVGIEEYEEKLLDGLTPSRSFSF